MEVIRAENFEKLNLRKIEKNREKARRNLLKREHNSKNKIDQNRKTSRGMKVKFSKI